MAKKRFNTLDDCRRYLASLINRMESGEVDHKEGSKRAYVANILISCIKDAELEKRVEELENQLESKQ